MQAFCLATFRRSVACVAIPPDGGQTERCSD